MTQTIQNLFGPVEISSLLSALTVCTLALLPAFAYRLLRRALLACDRCSDEYTEGHHCPNCGAYGPGDDGLCPSCEHEGAFDPDWYSPATPGTQLLFPFADYPPAFRIRTDWLARHLLSQQEEF